MLIKRSLFASMMFFAMHAQAGTKNDLSAMNGIWIGKACTGIHYSTAYTQNLGGSYVGYNNPVKIEFNSAAGTFKADTLVSSMYLLNNVKQIDGQKTQVQTYNAMSDTYIKAKTSPGTLTVEQFNTTSFKSLGGKERDTLATIKLEGSQLKIKYTIYVQNDKYDNIECTLEKQ